MIQQFTNSVRIIQISFVSSGTDAMEHRQLLVQIIECLLIGHAVKLRIGTKLQISEYSLIRIFVLISNSMV